MRHLTCALLAGAAVAMFASEASAATAQEQRQQKQAEIPRCAQSLGNMAVEQPQRNWWSELKLGSPEALIKIFVQQSGCFALVDRGAGLAAAQRERALASGGDLRQGSNVGGGQIVAADYVLVPDIVSQNANASGNNFGAALGGLLGNCTLGASGTSAVDELKLKPPAIAPSVRLPSKPPSAAPKLLPLARAFCEMMSGTNT